MGMGPNSQVGQARYPGFDPYIPVPSPGFEIAVSYILWSGRHLPITLKGDINGQALEFIDPKVQLLPGNGLGEQCQNPFD